MLMHILKMLPCIVGLVVLLAGPVSAAEWAPQEGPLMTRWADKVTPETAHDEYPRPQMVRETWRNLNGLWEYAIRPRDAKQPQQWDGEILVPFCIESSLSGVMQRVSPEQAVWYRRTFSVPEDWSGRRVLVHFGAADWEATVWVNGEQAGAHRGGYDPFTFEITGLLQEGENEIVVRVWDPTDQGHQPRGKQVRNPHGIWYTPVTGIWQTVWLEPVPEEYIRSLRIVPDVDDSSVHVTAHASEEGTVRVQVRDDGRTVSQADGRMGKPVTVQLDNPKLWSPDEPHLYDLRIELVHQGESVDRVGSYCGLRKIEVKPDEQGVNRLFLNGEPLFQYGTLDQGWWPDGLYTAPTDEALKYDIAVTKQHGFNMIRKHVKVEPARWYYWCDRLGMLVWQDMPNGDAHPKWNRDVDVEGPELRRSAASANNFRIELTELVEDFHNYPSIVVWVPFNERWGQFDTEGIVELVRRLDPTRPVNAASGGNFLGVGDILDWHSYPNPKFLRTDEHMAVVQGEFGGLGLPLEGHTWLKKGNWGYRSFGSREALTEAYLQKVNMIRAMIGKGLAAAIYTQTSDVEIEVNGLMTYDRDVIKMDPERVAKANRKLYEPPPAVKTLVPTSQKQPQTWRYTTEEPTKGWQQSDFNAASWEAAPGGFGTEGTPGAVVGTTWDSSDIWLRRTFELDDVPDEVQLLIHHDEDAEVYLNGVRAAGPRGYTTGYTLVPIAPKARASLKTGENVVAIHCRQTGGGQYIDAGLVELVPREVPQQ